MGILDLGPLREGIARNIANAPLAAPGDECGAFDAVGKKVALAVHFVRTGDGANGPGRARTAARHEE